MMWEEGFSRSFALRGFAEKLTDSSLPSAVVYAAENDSRAASRLERGMQKVFIKQFG